MNENLPINVAAENDQIGSITYANEVVATIVGMTAAEVDGVAGMSNVGGFADLFAAKKTITKGVRVEVGVEETSIDLTLVVEYGKPIQKVCTDVQESVRKAVETMTGLHVVKVDVHVTGVSFERESKEMEAGYIKATAVEKPEPEPEPEDEEIEAIEIEEEVEEIDESDATEAADAPDGEAAEGGEPQEE